VGVTALQDGVIRLVVVLQGIGYFHLQRKSGLQDAYRPTCGTARFLTMVLTRASPGDEPVPDACEKHRGTTRCVRLRAHRKYEGIMPKYVGYWDFSLR
jgi:hypothetical protein